MYSIGSLGITAVKQGITDICYGITLKYLGITHSETKCCEIGMRTKK